MKNLLLAILALSLSASATNHTVCATATCASHGSGNGSDWNNTFTTLPGTLVRGDTYYVAAGSYGDYSLNTSGSTTITIKHATTADHGPATGWSDTFVGQGVWNSWEFSTSACSLTFDGVTGGGPGSWDSGFGFAITMPISGGQSHAIGWQGSGTCSNVIFQHVDIAGRGRAYALGDTDLFYLTSTYGNWRMSYTYQHDTDRTMILSWPSNAGSTNPTADSPSGMTIEYSYFARNGVAEHREAWSFGSDSEVIGRYNLFEDIFGTGIFAAVTGGGTAQNWQIYGNAIYWTGTYNDGNLNTGIIVIGDQVCPGTGGTGQCYTAKNWRVYNNIIANVQSNSFTAGMDIESTSGFFTCKNNIWYNNHQTDPSLGCGGTDVNYNSYYSNNSNSSGLSGANDVATTGNPFALTNPWLSTNVNNANTAWQLVASIAGLTLSPIDCSAFSGFCNLDMLGRTFGSGTWDRGALIFGSALLLAPAPSRGMFAELEPWELF